MAIDRASSANDFLRVGTTGDRPPRPRLEDTGYSGAIEVSDSVGVKVGQAAPVIVIFDEIVLGISEYNLRTHWSALIVISRGRDTTEEGCRSRLEQTVGERERRVFTFLVFVQSIGVQQR